jgi:16S rRNA (guanine527-N7)-methyltransferase
LEAVSRETTERLTVYVDLLLRWNRTINLISRRDETFVWERHVADAVGLAPYLPDGADTAIDLGSGAGLPGLVLAIVTGRHFHLVEADQRKSAFLREAIRATAATASVHAVRIEALHLAPVPVVTARALAPLDVLLGWAVPFLAPGGVCVFPKGRGVEAELTRAASQWHMRVERAPSATDPTATILRLSEIRRVRHEC